MRREILLPILGFLAGFIVAAIVFWQPTVQTGGAPQQAASEASPSREAASSTPGDHSHRRLTVTSRESAGFAPVADSAPKPQGAAEIFHDAIGKLKDMDFGRRQAAIDSLVKQLRAAGPEGLQVLRDYFRAGQDVKFQNGYTIVNGVPVQSLRVALLNLLGDWPGNETLDLTREILRTTSHLSEASVAISQMEKSAPGVYRAEALQAIQAIQQRAVDSGAKDPWETGGTVLFDVMRKLKATELLPAAETAVGKNPWAAPQFMASLDALPAEVRAPALQRLFQNEAVAKNLASNPWAMQSLNYSEPVVAQNVAQIFTANTDKRFRENFLATFANTQTVGFSGGVSFVAAGSTAGSTGGDTAGDRVAKLQARAAFLDTIAPQCNTPVLQERLQDARDALQTAIANPSDNGLIKRGSGTLILGSEVNTYSGSTTITGGGSIQISTSTEKK